MKRTLIVMLALAALGGCATHSEPKPAVCDGKQRRPANPYGSVLPSAPGKDGAPAATPPAPATPGPQSSIDPKSFAPCGAKA